jgi:hypothetical protein
MNQCVGVVHRMRRWCGFVLAALALSGLAGPARAQAMAAFGQFQVNSGLRGYVYGAGVVPPLTKAFTFTTGMQTTTSPSTEDARMPSRTQVESTPAPPRCGSTR